MRLAAKAIIDGYDVPLEKRSVIVEQMLATLENPKSSPRDKAIAAKTLLLIPRLQLDAAKIAIEQAKWKREKEAADSTSDQPADDDLDDELRGWIESQGYQKAADRPQEPGRHGGAREQGPMEVGPPPGPPEQGVA